MPRVNYLMAFLSIDDFLFQAIKSIEDDKYKDKNLILVNNGDCKDEDVLKFISNFKCIDICYATEKMRGLGEALNTGLDMCDGEFIARLDADDINFFDRTERQVEYLMNNDEIVGVGGLAKIIDANGIVIGRKKVPKIRSLIRQKSMLRYDNPFIHPCMMLRRSVLEEQRYGANKTGCQDWDLWIRLSLDGALLENMREYLIYYRMHSAQVSQLTNQRYAKPLVDALRNLDKMLLDDYLFQRLYLEKDKIDLKSLYKIVVRESVYFNNFFSIKKIIAHLVRAIKR